MPGETKGPARAYASPPDGVLFEVVSLPMAARAWSWDDGTVWFEMWAAGCASTFNGKSTEVRAFAAQLLAACDAADAGLAARRAEEAREAQEAEEAARERGSVAP